MSETSGASLERDFFETRPPGTLVAKVVQDVDFIDIGTPESLLAAGKLIGEFMIRHHVPQPPLAERFPANA